ncbi:MarR family winged helix-turn-helix transcriptional regulator [Lachnospiraceae bacterium NSJ-143]|nr:MarR family winged helix-turn-helix transcriptional regulator [Lachnospiraceae bacterium NSJ-143]
MKNKIRKQIELMNSSIRKTNAIYGQWAKKFGLSFNSLMVLYTIDETPGCTQKQISQSWLIPKQTVHTILMDFSRKGYIEFNTDNDDRREKTVRFTENGRRYASSILSRLYYIEEMAMEKLGEETRFQLVDSNIKYCDTLIETFNQEVQNE